MAIAMATTSPSPASRLLLRACLPLGLLAIAPLGCGADDDVAFRSGSAGASGGGGLGRGGNAGRGGGAPGKGGGAGKGGEAGKGGAPGTGGGVAGDGGSPAAGAGGGGEAGVGGDSGAAGTSGVVGGGGGAGGGGGDIAGTGGSVAGTGGTGGSLAGTGGTGGSVAGTGGTGGSVAGTGGTGGSVAGTGGTGGSVAGTGGTGGTGGSVAGTGGTGGSVAGTGGTGGSAGGVTEPPLTDPVPLGDAFLVSDKLGGPIADLAATKSKVVVSEQNKFYRVVRAYPIAPNVPESDVVKIATEQQGDAFEQVEANGGDDRLLIPGGLNGTRLFTDDSVKLGNSGFSAYNPVGFVGEGASAVVCGSNISDPGLRTRCFVDGVETFSAFGEFMVGGAGVVRTAGWSQRNWATLKTGKYVDEETLLPGARAGTFRGTSYAFCRRCQNTGGPALPDCALEAGMDVVEWGEVTSTDPKILLSRHGRFALASIAKQEVFVTPRYVILLGTESHHLVVIDRGARAIVLEQDDVLKAAVNDTHLIYGEAAKIFARPLP
jgi:hypothetical protein